ncbi:MAG: flavin reductase family protein [Oscillospiraceae bacterium]|nr:flavin reductase family protein [Oscillospiraceae bacterium]
MGFKSIEPRELQGNVFDLVGEKWMLLTAKKSCGAHNTMTASWGGMGIMWGKPVAWCVVRPVRYTYEFMEESDYFTLSFLPDGEEYRKALNLLGTKSGRAGDKIRESGLNVFDVEKFNGKASAFTESDLIMTCRKLYYQDVDPSNFTDETLDKSNYPKKDYHRMYFGEISDCLIRIGEDSVE